MAGRPTLLIVPLTHSDAAAMRAAMDAAVAAGADAVEARLDFLDDASEAALRTLLTRPPCPVLATCRSAREGGRHAGTTAQRLAIAATAARLGARWVDVELADLGAAGELLAAGPVRDGRTDVIVSSHDFRGRPADLGERLAAMERSEGRIAKVAFAAAGPEDAWAAFDALRTGRKPAMALAMGEAGLASRILARKFGAFGTFAALDAAGASAPGQPTIGDLRGLYRWEAIGPETKVFGVVGCPVGHSMSPAIHNAAFAAADVDAVYVPLRVEPDAAAFDRFIDAVLRRPWTDVVGLSVTIPHKHHAFQRVGAENVDDLSAAIGAINTIRFTGDPDRPLLGINTDYAAALDALVDAMACTREDLRGSAVAVLGAGGAARAIVAALAYYGAETTIYNRTVARAEDLAAEFDSPDGPVRAAGLDRLGRLDADVLINCTPIGMHPHTDACPLPESTALHPGTVVFDTIYNPVATRLLRRAEEAGCVTVSGVEMFINQAVAQYAWWTELNPPADVMRRVVLERLGAGS
ncbi:MAG: shikimate dehydrogenase [Planctomycetes bacterium]|nr:shikimate dehydrogenase [Planctomycetota bacterium]